MDSPYKFVDLSRHNFTSMASPKYCPRLQLDFSSCQDLVEYLQRRPEIHFLDCCFTDALGKWHHCTATTDHLDVKDLEGGWAFDASSIPLFERIDNCDYVMKPDTRCCFLDPFAAYPTLHMIGSIYRHDGTIYEKCPRETLRRACDFMVKCGIADQVFIGPEAEFFIFSNVQFSVDPHHMMFSLDGDEAYWNSRHRVGTKGFEISSAIGSSSPTSRLATPSRVETDCGNLGHRANLKQGYMTSRPVDSLSDMRSEMVLTLEQLGIKTEKHHHEVATCQMEINVAATPALQAADNLQILKYVVKNVAHRARRSATFMPKPLGNDNGSGMHCNQSLWKDGKNLFYDESSTFHQMSTMAMHYAAGILHHAWALLAFACPTTNSYRRLVPEFEAPIHLTYSAGNRSTAIRIPIGGTPKTKRLEFRSPDASGCPHLLFAAMLLAGLDGIEKKMELPVRGEGNLFDPSNPTAKVTRKSPTDLKQSLEALEADTEFLTRNGIFHENLLKSYIKHKRREAAQVRWTPHPVEFQLYYAC